jgi:hypothetical protein
VCMTTGAPKNWKVTQVGDRLATEGEVWVVYSAGGGFEDNSNTLGNVGLHSRQGQP